MRGEPAYTTALGAGVRKDLQRRRADPWALVGWLAVPFLLGGLLTFITSGGSGGGPPRIPILLTNHDDSLLSEFLLGTLQQAPQEGGLDVTVVEEAEGRARVTAGEASALLVIPEGFSDAFLREEPTTLQLWTNPAERIRPQIVQTGLDLVADGHFYLHRLFGGELQELSTLLAAEEIPETAQIAALSSAVHDKVRALSPHVSGDLITVEPPPPDAEGEEERDSPSFALLLFPGIVIMALLFIAQGLSEELWRERELGTLRRLVSSPAGLRTLLESKVCSTAVVLFLLNGLLLGVGFAYHSLPWSRLPVAIAWVVLTGIFFYLLLTLIQMYASSRRAGALITQFLILPLMMVGGSFFPTEVLPGFLGTVGAWTPNGYAVEQLKGYLLQDFDAAALLLPAILFAGVSLLLFLWVARRNARAFAVVP